MSRMRIIVVDDHSLVRAGIKALVNRQADMEVVGEASSVSDALPLLSLCPQIVLLDLSMPSGGSLELIRSFRDSADGPRFIVVSMHDDPAYARSALGAGAMGYVVKTLGEQDLLEAIRAVARGRIVVDLDNPSASAEVCRSLTLRRPASDLSDREVEVLKLLGQGFSNAEIAAKLDISPKTVATYKARISEKTGLKSTAEFVRFTADHGMDRSG